MQYRPNNPLSNTRSEKKLRKYIRPITATQASTPSVCVAPTSNSPISKPIDSMKICCLQSSYEGSGSILEGHDDCPDPALHVCEHEFHHRWVHKATANEQIDAAIAEGFDLFFNFMWGQPEDAVAGVDAIRYLESRNVTFLGLNSTTLLRSKLDFYRDARAAGLPVPASGADMKFPVFVKPSNICSSMFIDERSVCHNQAELELQLTRINELMAPRRKEAAKGKHSDNLISTGESAHEDVISNGNNGGHVKGNVHDHDDIVVQEYIPGRDFSTVVIEMGNTPVALNPTRITLSDDESAEDEKVDFFTFNRKFNPKTKEELLLRSDDPELYDQLCALAEQAWHVNKMHGSNWCTVDSRQRASDGKIFLLEVNPMPTVFYRYEHEWEDTVIRAAFPGGHRALINMLITTKLLQQGKYKDGVTLVAATFDKFSDGYDDSMAKNSQLYHLLKYLITTFDYSGTVLDLACGTGIFARKLFEHQKAHSLSPSTIVGNDISKGMVDKNPNPAAYKEYRIGLLQQVIMDTTEQFDHIVCITSLQYLDEATLSAVLARMFFVAQKSVTITIDEVPEAYNESLEKKGLKHMVVRNHIPQLNSFGVPRGWRVACRRREFAWTSPHTGHDVYITTFRFEALKAL